MYLEAMRREQHITIPQPGHERARRSPAVVCNEVHLPVLGEARQVLLQEGKGFGVQVGNDSRGRRMRGILNEKTEQELTRKE